MIYEDTAEELMRAMESFIQTEHARTFDKRSKGEGMVLKYLSCNSGTAVPNDLAEWSHNSPARIAATLNRLEEKGEIVREVDPNDRRKITIKITRAGSKRTSKEHSEMRNRITTTLKAMGEHDAKEFVRTIKLFFETSQKIKQQNHHGFIKKHKRV